MKRGAGTWLNLLAAAAVAFLLPGAAGKSPFSGSIAPEGGAPTARFHAGGPKAEVAVPPSCAGKGCHLPASHRRGTGAAFLNMHEGNVACLACHGKEPGNRFRVSFAGSGGAARLAVPDEERTGGPHDALGPPASCDLCHSEQGKNRLAAAGWKELPQGFASPIPMRMLREGGRKWVPDDVR